MKDKQIYKVKEDSPDGAVWLLGYFTDDGYWQPIPRKLEPKLYTKVQSFPTKPAFMEGLRV